MAWIREHLYLYYPMLVFLLYFAVEKLAGIDELKVYTQGDATYLFFDYKDDLLDELEFIDRRNKGAVAAVTSGEEPAVPVLKQGVPDPGGDIDPGEAGFPEGVEPKTMLVLGSSRLLYFDYVRFDRNFPEWEMFNFSAPVTAPAYYLYILERALERGVKPEYIVLETDPFQYNSGSDAFRKSNLGFSFDFRFMFKYFTHFQRDDVSYFLARNLFQSYRYPVDPGNLRRRLKDPNRPMLIAVPIVDMYQRAHRGAGKNVIPRETWFERDFATLELSAKKTLRWLYGNYKLDEEQFYFLERILETARENDIQVTLVRPQVSRPMTRILETDPRFADELGVWEERMDEIIEKHQVTYLDLGNREDYYCNEFVDGSHMALGCYHPMLVLVMQQYQYE